VFSADWSPDGTRILFVRGDSLYVAAADGGRPAFLATARTCTLPLVVHGRLDCLRHPEQHRRAGRSTFGNLSPSGIVLFPAGGGPPREVTDLSSTVGSPARSADGRRLYFISNRDGPRDIYTVTISGSGEVRGSVRRLTTGLGAISISLGANGERLAYTVYSAESNIWSLEIPGSGVANTDRATAVTSGSQVVEAIRVSQDGRWIVYDSNLGGRSHIWRVPVDGGTPQQLTNGPADEFAGTLSPDGRFVAYHSWRNGTRDIEVAPLDGGEPQRVTDSPASESYPVWSNHGNTVLFFDQTVPFRAYVTERGPDGGWSTPRLLATSVRNPAWSPDDSQVVYADVENEPAGRILVVSAVGGAAREVYRPSDGLPGASAADWGPDGRIYFKAHDDDGRASFWVLRQAAIPCCWLVSTISPAIGSSRLRRGRNGSTSIQNRQSDVYVADIAR
jgi:Tol biopolymer transport system component